MNADDVTGVFNRLFADRYRTRLVGGATEPEYLPPTDDRDGELRFREDFVASALHETAHWCLAGLPRLAFPDFGYWYEPQRDATLQAQFELVEAKPQALEWILSVAAGLAFRVSVDNFEVGAREALRCQVRRAVASRLERGLPPRARAMADELASFSAAGNRDYLCTYHYRELPQ